VWLPPSNAHLANSKRFEQLISLPSAVHVATHPCCAVHTPASPHHLQEVNDIRAGMEKAKNDIIKSTIAIMGTFSAIAFTITRLMGTM
jgi:hypothetical protein